MVLYLKFLKTTEIEKKEKTKKKELEWAKKNIQEGEDLLD